MSRDTECPYCGEDVEINHDDGYGYSEDETHQQECGACGKTFTYTTMIHFSYSPSKADCLNGGEHDYRKTATYPPEFARLRCKMCDDEKPLPANAEIRGGEDENCEHWLECEDEMNEEDYDAAE